MLRNYLKIAFRNILRNKVYSFINIAGLSIGMAATILILLWVTNEMSFNAFNRNLDRIYLVPQTQHYQTIGDYTVIPTPMPLAKTLKDDYPEVEQATRYEQGFGARVLGRNNKFFDETINFADSTFFKIFTFNFLEGDPNTALATPNSIVITSQTARKFFGDADPIGRRLTMDGKVDLKVTAVIKDVPKNSDLQFDGLAPTDVMKEIGFDYGGWDNNVIETFVLLHNPDQAGELSRKISGLIKKMENSNDPTTGNLFLYPFKDFHLYWAYGNARRIDDVVLFSLIALFILLIACINFVNIATARSARRATEVGVKKVVGATRFQIAGQFFGESIVLTLISLVIALVVVELLIPDFNNIAGSSIRMGGLGVTTLLSILAVAILTGILAGIYPSVFLSSLKPASTLRTKTSVTSKKFSLRRVLVVLQFAISVGLIISTAVVYLQMRYVFTKDIGLNTRNVVYFKLTPKLQSVANQLKNQLSQDPNILSASSSWTIPIFIGMNSSGWKWEGVPSNQTSLVSFTYGDYDYLKTFDIGLKAGRFFSPEHPADSTSVVINESFAKLIGNKSPVGMALRWNDVSWRVIGVVKDFNFLSLQEHVGPLAILDGYGTNARVMSIRVNSNDLPSTLSFIEQTCKDIDPGFVFNYHFLDKTFEEMYTSQQRLGKIFEAFAALAIIIACLGLFGLSSFAAEVRTKEVGIRKVLGASIPELVYLLSKELVGLVLIANIVAWPVAYYFMSKWLQTFAYRVDMNLLVFILATVTALLIAVATTSVQAIKAATANPVESLRYE